jgi:nucleotide-binding universal stress UspA family protein
MTERILCAVDFSECSHVALWQALLFAKTLEAKLDVLHAYYVPENIWPDLKVWQASASRPIWQIAEQQARSELDGFLARHGTDIRQRVDLHVLHKDPTSAIVDFAAEHGSTLIVMGTHGRSGPSRWVIGSVAERVVRLAPCPVLTVRESAGHARVVNLGRILVAVDFSDCSRLAARRAGELARAFGARLYVVHAWQVPVFVPPDAMVGESPRQLQTFARLAEQEAQDNLSSFVDQARKDGVPVDAARLLMGEPAHAIVLEAEQGDYDMVVLGTHGRTGMKHVVLGSVAEKVVRRGSRPVMTVRKANRPSAGR